MKKLVSLFLIAAMLFTFACAETEDMRTFYNPNNYGLLMVTDAFIAEDGDYVVQGCFGEIDMSDELDAKWIGFDEESVFTLMIDENAVIEMPVSNYSIEENVPADRDAVIAFANEMREALNDVSFYCEFEMNEDGVLTKLIYCYYPY